MKIRLIRHGLTWQGEQKKYQGALDTSLSDNGRRLLIRAEDDPEVVYVTPLVRTQETAGILFPDSRQVVIDALKEMNFGAFEGRSFREMENDADYRKWVEGNCEGKCPGGEDKPAFSSRVCRAFESLVNTALQEEKDELVIVAHGGTQMAVLEKWGGSGKAYYEWQTPCGRGWLLDTRSWPASLAVLSELNYVKGSTE